MPARVADENWANELERLSGVAKMDADFVGLLETSLQETEVARSMSESVASRLSTSVQLQDALHESVSVHVVRGSVVEKDYV